MAKVFVIDDSRSVCFAIERMLSARGLDVVTRRSGQEALLSLEDEMPDLVMCDLVLPDIEGFQICAFLKNHPVLGDVPVIVISGIVDEEVRREAAEVGAVAVMKKPFTSDEMVRLVEELLADKPTSDDNTDEADNDESPADDEVEPTSVEDDASPEPDSADQPKAKTSKAPRILLSPRPGDGDQLLDRLEARLEPLAAIEALKFACVLSPNGDLRGYGPSKPTATHLAALPQLIRAAANTAAHTGHGKVGILTLETVGGGVLVVKPQEEGHLIVLGLADLSVLGKARYLLRRLSED